MAPRIEALLQKGLPPDLAALAIDALGAIGAPTSSAAIALYMRHREANVRQVAAQALGRTGGAEARAALLSGLRSGDAAVRALSATGLRTAGDGSSAADLAKALERGVTEAAPSLGAHCAGAACDALLGRFDKLPPLAQKATLEAMLGRAPALPEDLLLRAIDAAKAALGATEPAYFQGLKSAFKGSAKVRQALAAAGRSPAERRP